MVAAALLAAVFAAQVVVVVAVALLVAVFAVQMVVVELAPVMEAVRLSSVAPQFHCLLHALQQVT